MRLSTVLNQLVRPARRTLDHQRSLWRQPVSMAMRMPWPVFFLRFTQVDSPLRCSRQLYLSSWPDGHLSCRFVMVLVEGTDEVTGSSLLQVHHSRIEDILQGRTFADLVSIDGGGRRLVNLEALDRTVAIT